HSILIILFSQSTKLIAIFLDTGYNEFDLTMLLYMIPGGVIGGLLGTILHKRISLRRVQTIFNVSLFSIIVLNLYNAMNGFLIVING
ncbi:MAG: sulfite exporter TauE/SafE family protein, partial [Spirochaetes bacterium]|nr:sulfite exporter TauE/SafE family protein [Spirochaetota bacterium]